MLHACQAASQSPPHGVYYACSIPAKRLASPPTLGASYACRRRTQRLLQAVVLSLPGSVNPTMHCMAAGVWFSVFLRATLCQLRMKQRCTGLCRRRMAMCELVCACVCSGLHHRVLERLRTLCLLEGNRPGRQCMECSDGLVLASMRVCVVCAGVCILPIPVACYGCSCWHICQCLWAAVG